jgi:hypothetical protein
LKDINLQDKNVDDQDGFDQKNLKRQANNIQTSFKHIHGHP